LLRHSSYRVHWCPWRWRVRGSRTEEVEDLAGVGSGGRDEKLGLALADEVGLDLREALLERVRQAQEERDADGVGWHTGSRSGY
jgi:hypothetical protein